MTTRLLRACSGKSHSWLTPTTSRSKPSANRISVADGSSETIRISKMYHTGMLEEGETTSHSAYSASLRYAFLLLLSVPLFVQDILLPQLLKRAELRIPALHDLFRRHILLQFPYGLIVANEQQH